MVTLAPFVLLVLAAGEAHLRSHAELSPDISRRALADDADNFKDLGVLEDCIDFDQEEIPTWWYAAGESRAVALVPRAGRRMRVIVATGLYQMSTHNVRVEEMTEFSCQGVSTRPKGVLESLRIVQSTDIGGASPRAVSGRGSESTSDDAPAGTSLRRFHGNGPNNQNFLGQPGEDTRILAIPNTKEKGDFRLAFFMSDVEKIPDEKDPSGFISSRVQYLMVMKVADRGADRSQFSEGPVFRLTPAWSGSTAASLSTLEKNWSPFLLSEPDGRPPEVYAFQWLESPASSSVVLRIALGTGRLVERLEVPGVSGPLRRAIGLGHKRSISGGTPAIRFNETTFLAVGHTVNHETRSYAMFGYVFSSEPPFRILAATPEFVCDCDDPRPQDLKMQKKPKWPNPPQQLSFGDPDAGKGRVIFPTGLSKLYVKGRAALLLSLSNNDHDAVMMAFRPRLLLSRLVRLQYED